VGGEGGLSQGSRIRTSNSRSRIRLPRSLSRNALLIAYRSFAMTHCSAQMINRVFLSAMGLYGAEQEVKQNAKLTHRARFLSEVLNNS
jgi:hypothetical protein